MSGSFEDMLRDVAVESGLIPTEHPELQEGEILEVLSSEFTETNELPAVVEHAEKAQDIAEQLDDLADKAAELADEDEKFASVSAESLHREFGTIMRCAGMGIKATSFESAMSDKGRLLGLARDARAYANAARVTRDQKLDYSPEGEIIHFLRRDAARLDKAQTVLKGVGVTLRKRVTDLKEKPVTIKHDGVARFMSNGGKPVADLKDAIKHEAAYLVKLHSAVEAGVKEIAAMAKQLSTGANGPTLDSLVKTRHFTAARDLQTGKGALMGSYWVERTDAEHEFDNLIVPKYSRKNAVGVKADSVISAVTNGVVGAYSSWWVGSAIVMGGAMLGAPAVVLGAAALLGTAPVIAAAGVAAGSTAYGVVQDHSTRKSVASATDLEQVVNTVIQYDKYTDGIKLFPDSLNELIKQAKGNTEGLDPNQKKALSGVCNALETSLARLVTLTDIGYEQAIYTTTMLATALNSLSAKVS